MKYVDRVREPESVFPQALESVLWVQGLVEACERGEKSLQDGTPRPRYRYSWVE